MQRHLMTREKIRNAIFQTKLRKDKLHKALFPFL